MSNHTTVFIENRSNITAHFQWKTLPTEEYENEEKRRQYLLRCRKAVCLENFTEERKTEKGSCKDHTSLLRNVVQEEMAKIQEDPMLFSSAIFCIEPLEGEIQPYSWAEIKVTFKPLEALEYQIMAYCNISGRESRLPLHLRGEGQGPLVELSCPSVNLGNILVNNPHICEVKLINQGAINAPFTCIPSTTNVGFFKFAPEEGIITPGEIQTIQISFSATVLGRFEEEVRFSVAGSPVPAILTIKGNVTRPTLHFELDELSFGDISFVTLGEQAQGEASSPQGWPAQPDVHCRAGHGCCPGSAGHPHHAWLDLTFRYRKQISELKWGKPLQAAITVSSTGVMSPFVG
uniref:hydrocephalus-inducing protein homolog n=1 Tax=Lonchura striata TaxID=40157 RepID=UPI0012935CB6|nr:hydrocephalus-inducing protein homolog [Lonchura striata domestica]